MPKDIGTYLDAVADDTSMDWAVDSAPTLGTVIFENSARGQIADSVLA